MCSNCKTTTEADWFIEEEYKYIEGCICKTGRVRKNINYFFCPLCFKKFPVDDTFAYPWKERSKNETIFINSN